MAFWRKPAAPQVIGVLTTPAPKTWWQANRHLVFLAVGVTGGFWLAVHFGAAAPTTSSPCTTTTAHPSASAAASPHPTSTSAHRH